MSLPRALLIAVIMLMSLAAVPPAHAHTLSESYSSWLISGDTVRLQFTVPDVEARRLSASGKDLPSGETLGRYLARHVGAASGSKRCAMKEMPRALAAIPGFSRFEFTFSCPSAVSLRVWTTAFQDFVASHTDFARIQDGDGNFFEQVLTAEHPAAEVTGGDSASALENASFLTFVTMGIMHIFTGVDHMSFMLGLVLISRRVRDLLFVVTGFTLGHSLTLALAVTGILRPEGQYIDALVALTIALIGAENIGDATHRPLPVAVSLGGLLLLMAVAKQFGAGVTLPAMLLVGGGVFAASYLMLAGHLRDAGRVRLVVTLVFGLIHGFGFASNLLEMRLPPQRLAELLVGFNLGVEVGQVVVVLTALLLAAVLKRVHLAIPRPLFTDFAAALLVAEGLYWFVTRSVALT